MEKKLKIALAKRYKKESNNIKSEIFVSTKIKKREI